MPGWSRSGPARATWTPEVSTEGLLDYLRESPSPFHAARSSARLLEAAGFQELMEIAPWERERGRYFIRRGGSLVAWSTEGEYAATSGFRIVGAHTDSPNLRIKPRPDLARAGFQLLGVEVYGGPILTSWLDRDLGLSGRVVVRDEAGNARQELFQVDDPILRVSRLAIHLDRSVKEGEHFNPQQHLAPHWGFGTAPGDFAAYLASLVDVDPSDVLAWDAMTHDAQPPALIGRDQELLASGRLDNLATSYAATEALIAAVATAPAQIPLIALFDHEEIGSMSERGAFSSLLTTVLERIVLTLGGGREDLHVALANSVVASGDMAHATHPNYADRHEPQHQIAINGGPVLKVNTNLRYATDAVGAAAFKDACDRAGVPCQEFVVRSDLPCGSTVGPMTAALTGVTTVDFGAAMLSMHSIREVTGVADQEMYAAALTAFLS